MGLVTWPWPASPSPSLLGDSGSLSFSSKFLLFSDTAFAWIVGWGWGLGVVVLVFFFSVFVVVVVMCCL